ncbi:MAG: S-layer homology domain-containing protein [Paenibacillaceae bacterium]|nr:S-layer homology domain-containing protein [Paenibacillaceae bacterium]
MKLSKKTAILGLSTALLLSAVPPVFADEAIAVPAPSVNWGPLSQEKINLMIAAGELPPGTKAGNDSAVDAKISKEKAIELAAGYIAIPEGYILQSVNYNSSNVPAGHGVWYLNYIKQKDDRYYGNINFSIDGDNGTLLNYNSYENDPDRKPVYPPPVDLAKAKQLAGDLLQKMNASQAANVAYNNDYESSFKTPLTGDVRYQIRYDRVENGVPYPQNGISFTIDGTGKLTDYSFNWDDSVTFAKPEKTLSATEATYIFKQNPALTYINIYNPKPAGSMQVALAYNTVTAAIYADSGKRINDLNGRSNGPAGGTLTDKPLAAKPDGSLNLTKDQAIARVTALFPLPEGAVLENASYNEQSDTSPGLKGGSSWNLSWRYYKDDKDVNQEYINATVNSRTGEVTNYNRNQPYLYDRLPAGTPEPELIGSDKAETLAVDFIKKAMPAYTDQLALIQANSLDQQLLQMKMAAGGMTARTVNVSFQRLLHGSVPSEFEGASVTVNLITGEVIGFYNNFQKFDYPQQMPSVITADEAADKLLSQFKVEKRYYVPDNYAIMFSSYMPSSSATAAAPREAQLIYQLVPLNPNDNVYLDATTGDWKTRDTGETTVPGPVVADDIAGHWAENALQLMIEYKALDVKDGKANPNQAVTRGEMIKMLITAMNGGNFYAQAYGASRKASFADVANGSAYFSYVEAAVDNNIIDKTDTSFNPEGTMNRDELAQLIVRALGYNKLAELDGLFNLNVSDADNVTNKGHVAIALKLGILTSGDDGAFAPKSVVSRAVAATAFTRYLEKRAALSDNPVPRY